MRSAGIGHRPHRRVNQTVTFDRQGSAGYEGDPAARAPAWSQEKEGKTLKRSFGLVATAATLALAPVAAEAASAPAPRGSEPAEAEAQLQGSPTLFFLAAIVGVALGIFLLIDDDDDDGMSP